MEEGAEAPCFGSLDDVDREDLDVGQGFVAPVGLHCGDLVDDVHSGGDGSEHGVRGGRPGVLLVEVGVVDGVDKELAASGVGAAGVGHGDGAPDVGVALPELVLDGVSGSAHAGSGGVPALDHESVDDPVEDDAVVEALLRQFHEVAGGDGHVIVHLDLDVAHGGVHDYLSHGDTESVPVDKGGHRNEIGAW